MGVWPGYTLKKSKFYQAILVLYTWKITKRSRYAELEKEREKIRQELMLQMQENMDNMMSWDEKVCLFFFNFDNLFATWIQNLWYNKVNKCK